MLYRPVGVIDRPAGCTSDLACKEKPKLKVPPVEVFEMRCWARATLYVNRFIDLQDAVDTLQTDAEESGVVEAFGQDYVQKIMADTFEVARS